VNTEEAGELFFLREKTIRALFFSDALFTNRRASLHRSAQLGKAVVNVSSERDWGGSKVDCLCGVEVNLLYWGMTQHYDCLGVKNRK
jgi:hypothetical protein